MPYPMMERGKNASMMGPRRRRRSDRKAAMTGGQSEGDENLHRESQGEGARRTRQDSSDGVRRYREELGGSRRVSQTDDLRGREATIS
jgi:hypothetical protein